MRKETNEFIGGQPFADAVSIDCYANANPDSNKIDVHAVVVFDTAEFGDEVLSPVKFTLSFWNAELVIVVPEVERHLIEIDHHTVARVTPESSGSKTTKIRKAGSLKGKFKNLLFRIQGNAEIARTDDVTFESRLGSMKIKSSVTDDGHYRWRVSSYLDQVLSGPAWDTGKPRLSVIKKKVSKIAPQIRVEVRCKRADLHIDNVILKKSAVAKYGTNISQAKAIAVEAYIRTKLFSMGVIKEEGNTEDSKFVIGADLIEIL